MEGPVAAMPLSGCRVLDLTDERGLLCGQLLADLGATVVHIEPPGGSPARADDVLWRVHTRNQQSVLLDLNAAAGRTEFLDLVRRCDIVVESGAFPMDELGLDVPGARRGQPVTCLRRDLAVRHIRPEARLRRDRPRGAGRGGQHGRDRVCGPCPTARRRRHRVVARGGGRGRRCAPGTAAGAPHGAAFAHRSLGAGSDEPRRGVHGAERSAGLAALAAHRSRRRPGHRHRRLRRWVREQRRRPDRADAALHGAPGPLDGGRGRARCRYG